MGHFKVAQHKNTVTNHGDRRIGMELECYYPPEATREDVEGLLVSVFEETLREINECDLP